MWRKRMLMLLFAAVLSTISTVSYRIPSISLRSAAAQSTCTPPLYQGYPSSCSAINLRWLNRDPISLIDHYDILRSGVKIGEAPGSAISYSDLVGCNFGASYTIRQVMKSGVTCSTNTTGNLPHTKPCDLCTGSGPTVNLVSSASFTSPVAPGSIVTLFANPGQPLTSATASADRLPLPNNLANTQVLVDGTPASLFFVSPDQINLLLPQTGIGVINIVVTGPNGERTEGNALTGPNPAIFTASSNGNGVAAAVVTSDGLNYQSIFDSNKNAIPISVSNGNQPNYLILFGTGIKNQGEVQVKIGGQPCTVMWSGPHPTLAGLEQINVQLPQSVRGYGLVLITVSVGGFIANFSLINIE